jgi:16S rRNA (guanine1207-N2)-methyltransferase
MKKTILPPHALAALIAKRVRPPVAVALGSPAGVVELLAALEAQESVCYQMDLYQADRLREELDQRSVGAQVVTAPDLWDLPAKFQTVFYPVPQGGERSLKIDMVEQAYHILRPHGTLIVLSPYEYDQLFPDLLKKVFGRVHTSASGTGCVFWCHRESDRPRRRHEMTFHARIGEGPSLAFLSRPGIFSYGRMDEGARALVETISVEPGDQILDLGCGCGTNGIFAQLRSGPDGKVVFVDSNLRALVLAEQNARNNGVANYEVAASSRVEVPPESLFDVALANPPYYAQGSIAQLFAERARQLLRAGGRFYLVTRQADQVGPVVAANFGPTEAVERRGYVVLCAQVDL